MSEGTQRRLAAIVSTDVVGYSRLMGSDETGTIAALRAHRQELIDPLIGRHGGRIVKTMGDGLLLEFPSVVNATQCAVELQQGMVERNDTIDPDRRIVLRIGINLGDIIIEGDDILGDGVNVAARLQEIADPGGVAVSRRVFEDVQDRLDTPFQDIGMQILKNIARPVQVWNWSPAGAPAAVEAGSAGDDILPLRDKPSIAVLPFENMSGDPEQEYFADGIAEDILTRLAMWRHFPVIARNSSFIYKGGTRDVKAVGRELGARYVLEGSVRKAGNRVRITVQLIDAESGHHIWAEQYNRGLEDIFAVQDEITDAIVTALEPAVGRAEMQRAQRRDPENLDAWDLYQRGMWHMSKSTREDITRARELMQQSAAEDPNFAPPFAGLGLTGFFEISLGFAADPDTTLAIAREAAQRSVRLDELDPHAQVALGYTSSWSRDYDIGLTAARRAVELNPSFALGYHCLGGANIMVGRFDDAVEAMEQAVRIGPRDPWLFLYFAGVCACRYMLRDYERSVEAAQVSVERFAQYASGHRFLAMALAQLGREDDAQRALARFLMISPDHTLRSARHSYPFRQEADLEHYLDGLRKAGLPE